jgi:type IV secretion system protein TrbL
MGVSTNTANDLMVVFSNTISAGFDALSGAVNGVFAAMIALVVAMTGVQWALSSNRDVLAAGFGKILLIGFFAYLINDWQALSQTIWNGFITLGLRAGGGGLSRSDFLNPGAILEQGWRIVKALGDTPAPAGGPLDIMRNLTDALVLGLAMIGIMLAFAVLALQIIVTLLEFKIVTLGGFVLLPFGIWSKSSFLAERPLGFVVSSGLKVLALAIVVSGARSVFDQLQPSTAPDLYEALAILAAAILLAMLAIFIPNLAAALVSGGPALGAGSAVTSALVVGGAGALAAAGVTGLGAAAGRLAGASRAAAGAGFDRPPSPPSPSAPPRPSNDNPPRSPQSGSPGSAARPTGVSEPAATWAGPAAEPASGGAWRETAADPTATGANADAGSASSRRDPERIAREAGDARRAFHRAVAAEAQARPADTVRQRRSAALQTFFLANTGRSFLPASESVGALAPQLKPEEP